MRRCAAKAQILSKCRIRHSSQSAYFDAVALKQTAGELDQAQVVLPMLVVTDQDRPALRQPCQRPLHHPAPCLATPGKPLLPAVLTDRPDVADVPLVQAQVLLDLLGVGPLDDDRLDRRLQQLLIDDVRSGDHYPERATVAVGQHTLLGPRLASVGGVFPHLFPPRTGPCPASRRLPAISSGPPRVRRTPGPVPPRSSRRLRSCTSAGTSGAPSYRRRSVWGVCSTGSRCGGGR